jgi:hypothetical protein
MGDLLVRSAFLPQPFAFQWVLGATVEFAGTLAGTLAEGERWRVPESASTDRARREPRRSIVSESEFQPVGTSDDRMFGPRAFVVSGFEPSEQESFLRVLRDACVDDVPVCFAGDREVHERLGSLAASVQPTRQSRSNLARAVVLSGATEAELHRVMSAYRSHGLPRPLWATLTETSAEWTLGDLLEELAAERAAIEGG